MEDVVSIKTCIMRSVAGKMIEKGIKTKFDKKVAVAVNELDVSYTDDEGAVLNLGVTAVMDRDELKNLIAALM